MTSEAATALIGALAGAIAGGTIAIAGNIFHDWWRDRRESKNLAHAIAGEISAICEVIRKRGYLGALAEHEKAARSGQPVIFQVFVKKNYFPIIESNLSKVGSLPTSMPLEVSRFLTLMKAAIEDLEALLEGRWNHQDATKLAAGYKELQEVLQQAIESGNRYVTLVATRFGSPH